MRAQYDDPPRALRGVHYLQWLSRLQIREAEFHRREVPTLQRRRPGGKEGAQGEHILRMRKLSHVQVHLRRQTSGGKVPKLRQRVPGGEIPEGRPGNRLPQQRVRLRARPRTRARSLTTKHVGAGVLTCPAERSSAVNQRRRLQNGKEAHCS